MKPLKGVMKTGDWNDAKSFRIACECQDVNHDVNTWIELQTDNDTKEITVGFFVETQTPFWKEGFNRIKAAWDVLFKGFHRGEHHLILDREAALNFSNVILDSVKEIEKWQQENKKKNS